MRDLSGRRLRHVEQEQKLAEWNQNAAKRRADKELEKKEKKQKLWAETHKAAEEYLAEGTVQPEEVSAAVREGLEEERKIRERRQAEAAKKLAGSTTVSAIDKLWGGESESSTSSSGEEDEQRQSTAKSGTAKSGAQEPTSQPSDSTASVSASEPTTSIPGIGNNPPKVQVLESGASSVPAVSEGHAKSDNIKGKSEDPARAVPEDVDLDAFDGMESLISCGGDALKAALAKRGLKCGGTVQQRAERLWSIKGLGREKWPASILAPSNP